MSDQTQSAPEAQEQVDGQATNSEQQGAAPKSDGPMVYGLDGQAPKSLKEHYASEMSGHPGLGTQMEEAAARALQQAEANSMERAEKQPQVDAADYWKQKYMDVQGRYASIAQYENIIRAMEDQPRLVDVMQNAIAGDVVRRDSAEDYDDIFGPDESNPTSDGNAPQMTEEQRIAAAREQGMRQAQVQMEMQEAIREFMEAGASPEEMDAFQEFLMNPSGLSAHDMLSMFRARNKRTATGQQPPKSPKEPKDLPPQPLAATSGHSDRPNDNAFVGVSGDGSRYFSGDPNKF